MALLLCLKLRQLWAASWTIDTGTLVALVGTVARLRVVQHGLHASKVIRCRKVNLERAAQERPLVAQELQELSVVLRAATDQVDGLAASGTKLHILAAVVETRAILLADQLVKLRNQVFVALLFRLGDVHKQRLIRRAGESAEKIEEVLLARRACGDDVLGALQIALERVDLLLRTADLGVLPLIAAYRDDLVSQIVVRRFGESIVGAGKF